MTPKFIEGIRKTIENRLQFDIQHLIQLKLLNYLTKILIMINILIIIA